MDKRKSVIESIQKLLSLRVSDEEIVDNLLDVGLSREEAKEFIIEAKKSSSVENDFVEQKSGVIGDDLLEEKQVSGDSSKKVFDDTVKKLSMNDQVISQIPFVKQDSPSIQLNKKEIINVKEKKEGLSSNEEFAASEKKYDDLIKSIKRDVGGGVTASTQNKSISSSNEVVTPLSSEVTLTPLKESLLTSTKIDLTKNQLSNSGESDSSTLKPVSSNLFVKENTSSELQVDSTTKPLKNISSISQSKSLDSFSTRPKSVESTSFSSLRPTTSKSTSFDSLQSTKLHSTKIDSVTPFPTKSSSNSNLAPSKDFEELWKKGIIVAVNAKLSEMKQLRDEIDLKINQRVDEAVKRELLQTKVLMESQKELIISSNRVALEQKQKEVTLIIDSKISELKQYNKFLEDTKKSIELIQTQQKESALEIKSVLGDAKKTKAQLLIEVNSELIKTKSQAQAFLDSASIQLNQMDERVNKTLELEKNIAEGLLVQAEQKIEQLTLSRADELISNLEVELNKLKVTTRDLSPEVLEDKMKLIEKFRLEFINNTQGSLSQINSAIQELNLKNELAQKALDEKTLAIDAKMDELTKFEKQFTQIIENVLNKHE